MLENLFGNTTIEKILFYLLKNERTYGSQLAQNFDSPLSNFQKALERLERGNIIISQLEGKTRVYQFNTRYPLLKEIQALLEKSYSFLPISLKKKYYEPPIRTRPRRKGKPL